MVTLGLSLNLLGAIILAFAQHRLTREIGLTLRFLDTSLRTITTPGDVYVFTGLERRWEDETKRNRRMSTVAWVLIAAGFFLQLLPLLVGGGE